MRLSDVATLVVQHGVERKMRKQAGVLLPLAVGAMLPGIARRALERAHVSERALDAAEDQKIAGAFPNLTEALKRMAGGIRKPSGGGGGEPMGWAGRPSGGSGGMTDFRRFDPAGAFPQPAQGSFGDALRGMADSTPAKAFGGQAAQGLGDSVKGLAASPLRGVSEGISGGIGESIKRMMLGREFGERKDPLHLGGTAAIQTFGKGVGEMGVELLRDMADKAMSAVGQVGDDAARQAILANLKRTDPVLSTADDKVLMEAYHTMTRFSPVLSTDKNAVRSFLRQAVMSGSGPDYMSIKLLADAERSVTGGGKD